MSTQEKMKTTTDTLTGKPFRYNETTIAPDGRTTVARYTSRTTAWLHPDRLTPTMLSQLNP